MPTAKTEVQPRFKRVISAKGFYREAASGALTGSMPVSESLGAPAAKGTTDIHAGFAASDAARPFPGPFTDPDFPRSTRITFGAAWDAGDVTVVGTDQFDSAQTEVIADVGGTTVEGIKVFKTVTSASKELVGASAHTASIGWGDKLGVSDELVAAVGVVAADGVTEAGTWDAGASAVTPTTVPNGAVVFSALYVASP